MCVGICYAAGSLSLFSHTQHTHTCTHTLTHSLSTHTPKTHSLTHTHLAEAQWEVRGGGVLGVLVLVLVVIGEGLVCQQLPVHEGKEVWVLPARAQPHHHHLPHLPLAAPVPLGGRRLVGAVGCVWVCVCGLCGGGRREGRTYVHGLNQQPHTKKEKTK